MFLTFWGVRGSYPVPGTATVRYGGQLNDRAFYRVYGKYFDRNRGFSTTGIADDWRASRIGGRIDLGQIDPPVQFFRQAGQPPGVVQQEEGRRAHLEDGHQQHVADELVEGPATEALRAALAADNIGTEIYYPLCMHEQECFRELGHGRGDFPAAEAAATSGLALPIFPGLRATELEFVVDAIVAAVAAGG